MQLNNVDLVFTYSKPNGEEVKINTRIDEHGNWEQWGGTKSELGDNVSLIEEIKDVVAQHLITNND